MANLPPPLLLALLPAEFVHEDSGRRYSALRILNAFQADSLPLVQRIGVFVALTAVRRRTQVLIELVKPDATTEPVAQLDLDYPSYDPIEVYQQGSNMTITFRMYGEYRFRVSADGTMLGEWTVRINP